MSKASHIASCSSTGNVGVSIVSGLGVLQMSCRTPNPLLFSFLLQFKTKVKDYVSNFFFNA